ncbi:MAG: hypothetical protein HQK93_01795 [Nitrospirae bacterium]|nr:hypothetical protein [Nitrospirota bacterium]
MKDNDHKLIICSTSQIIIFFCLALLISSSTVYADNNWTKCADEGGNCSFSGKKNVRYGANNSWVYRTIENGVGCSNSVFGDPIYGVVKACYIESKSEPVQANWTKCADEGGNCSFSGRKYVRYGANNSWVYRTIENGVGCNNGVFGDPIYGVVKACYTSSSQH